MGVDAKVTNTMHAVMEPGTGSNLRNQESLPFTWKRLIRPTHTTGLGTSNKQTIQVGGIFLLHICLEDLIFRVWFSVVPNFSVPILFGTFYIDSFIRGIFPEDLRVLSFHSIPVSILVEIPNQAEGNSKSAVSAAEQTDDPTGSYFLVCKQKWLPPKSDTPVLVLSTSDGLMMIQSHPNLVRQLLALTATGVMKFVRERPFYVLMSSFRGMLYIYPYICM